MPELHQEDPPADEAKSIETLKAMLLGGMGAQTPPIRRAQHAKSHGLVEAKLVIDKRLDEALAQGIFEPGREYRTLARFSNGRGPSQGGVLADTVPDVRGLALKVEIGGGRVQDFVLLSAPTFFIRTVADYLPFFRLAKAAAEGAVDLKNPSTLGEEWKAPFAQVAYAFKALNSSLIRPDSPLIPYFSSTPFRLGKLACKFSLLPSCGLCGSCERGDNYLRESLSLHLKQRSASFEFMIQVQTDPVSMPIEDPTVEWSVASSPYVKVATLHIPQQDFNSPERLEQDESMSFSPWNTLDEHQPLGGVNRARKIYDELAKNRK